MLLSCPFPPIEPPPTNVEFPDPRDLGDEDIVAVGSDFSPGTLLAAYRRGIFPWPHQRIVAWFSPDPRAVFPIEREVHWSRSLRRTLRRGVLPDGMRMPFVVTLDEAFDDVMRACGATRPEGTWITPPLRRGYSLLHRLGWAHSVEVWSEEATGRVLVGGIYGIRIGSLFAGESMFHLRTDASKVAFAHLVAALRVSGTTLFDVQVQNPHIESLGCIELARDEYLDRLSVAANAQARPLTLG